MNAVQLRARVRKAMKRRAEEIEEEEAGDLNLIPFLDMVMNVMVFLLAGISGGYVLGQINTTLPSSVSAEAATDTEPDEDPDEPPLQLVVSVTEQHLLVWSVSGEVGDLNEPHATLARTDDGGAGALPIYDYQELNDVLYEVADERWGGRARDRDTYEVILQADGDIPYDTIVAVMDHMRRRLPDPDDDTFPGGGDRPPPLAMPAEGEPFDPDAHPLFPDILFSMGFE